MAKEATLGQIRDLAIAQYDPDGGISISERAKVTRTEFGAWVEAWVWVDAETIRNVAPYRGHE